MSVIDMGLLKAIIYSYNLKNLGKTKKQSFSHTLYGTGGRDSFLKTVNGKRIGKNSVLIPAQHANKFETFLKAWNAEFKKIEVLIKGEIIKGEIIEQ